MWMAVTAKINKTQIMLEANFMCHTYVGGGKGYPLVLSRGTTPDRMGVPPPPNRTGGTPREQTDRCKNITFPNSSEYGRQKKEKIPLCFENLIKSSTFQYLVKLFPHINLRDIIVIFFKLETQQIDNKLKNTTITYNNFLQTATNGKSNQHKGYLHCQILPEKLSF